MFELATKEEICARLRTFRTRAGKAQNEINGVNQQTVSNWESGDVPKQVVQFGHFALAVGETPDSLLLVQDMALELVHARHKASAASIDALLEITLALVDMDKAAEKQGAGPLPSKIFADHLKSLKTYLLRGEPDGHTRESETPPHPAEAVEAARVAVQQVLVDIPTESIHHQPLYNAAIELEKLAAAQAYESAPAATQDSDEPKPKSSSTVVKLPSRRKKDRS